MKLLYQLMLFLTAIITLPLSSVVLAEDDYFDFGIKFFYGILENKPDRDLTENVELSVGDTYEIRVTPKEEGCISVSLIDASGHTELLFGDWVEAGRTYYIPQAGWFSLKPSKHKGRETLAFMASKGECNSLSYGDIQEGSEAYKERIKTAHLAEGKAYMGDGIADLKPSELENMSIKWGEVISRTYIFN